MDLLTRTARDGDLRRAFREDSYLKHNLDVAAAVEAGQVSSGWDHYLAHGLFEKRLGTPPVPDAVRRVVDCLPPVLPPEHLRVRVSGGRDAEVYRHLGRRIALSVQTALAAEDAEPTEPSARVLDFGCGCGRVLSWMPRLYDRAEFHGCDIDNEAIQWCRANLVDVGAFDHNPDWPPLPYEDAFFDVVYSISIFTHLPEDMQFAWLGELKRVTKPGGTLVLTTHGPGLFPRELKRLKPRYEKSGFHYYEGAETDGLPGFYRTTFHTPEYISREWGRLFTVSRIESRGLMNHQDVVLCRRAA